jgi:predicted transposase YdaD
LGFGFWIAIAQSLSSKTYRANLRTLKCYQEINEPRQEEEVMEIVTSWMREGIQTGKQQEAVLLIMRQLTRRCGALSPQLQERVTSLSVPQLEDLGEALLDFTGVDDLVAWLGE